MGTEIAPPHAQGTSIAIILPRARESSGPIPPWNTGKRMARMWRTSRTRPSVTQPTAPRWRAAVLSSSPQGAIRSVGPPQANTATSPGLRSSTSAISTS